MKNARKIQSRKSEIKMSEIGLKTLETELKMFGIGLKMLETEFRCRI